MAEVERDEGVCVCGGGGGGGGDAAFEHPYIFVSCDLHDKNCFYNCRPGHWIPMSFLWTALLTFNTAAHCIAKISVKNNAL